VSPLLQELHWLCVPERIYFRLAVLVYRCINGTEPRYLASELQQVADIESCGRLRSSSTALLHVPRSLHNSIGDRAFPVAAARVWNMPSSAITSLPSLQTFKRALKNEDATVSKIVRQHTLAATAALTLALLRDIYCGPEVLFETCVAMKFVDDDNEFNHIPTISSVGLLQCW